MAFGNDPAGSCFWELNYTKCFSLWFSFLCLPTFLPSIPFTPIWFGVGHLLAASDIEDWKFYPVGWEVVTGLVADALSWIFFQFSSKLLQIVEWFSYQQTDLLIEIVQSCTIQLSCSCFLPSVSVGYQSKNLDASLLGFTILCSLRSVVRCKLHTLNSRIWFYISVLCDAVPL